MTDSASHWARKCSTERLNDILANPDLLVGSDRPLWLPETVEAVQAEKDRRLADPNSADFRPTFF